MTKVIKRNKKEEQKKLAVRIICLTLVVVMAVTSLLAVLPSLFGTSDAEYQAQLQAMLDAGMIYLAEDGNYYYTDEYISLLTETEAATEDHTGHDHE